MNSLQTRERSSTEAGGRGRANELVTARTSATHNPHLFLASETCCLVLPNRRYMLFLLAHPLGIDPKSFSCQSNYRVKHRFVRSMYWPWIKLNFTFFGAAVFLESTRHLCYHPQPEAADYFCGSPPVPGTHGAGSDTATALDNSQSRLCPTKIPSPGHKRLRT